MAHRTITRWRRASTMRLARREILAAVNGPVIYLVVTVACLVAGITIKGYLDFVAANGTLVLASALQPPLLFAILIMTGFVGLSAAASLAGEKERGTLEVLFYGPVDTWAYILGKGLGLLAIYGLMLLAVAAYLVVVSLLTAIPVEGAAASLLVLSIGPATYMIAAGQLIASLTGRVRSALALMLLTLALFFAIDVGNQVLVTQSGEGVLGSAAQLLAAVAAVAAWLSPFNYLLRAVESIGLGAGWGIALNFVVPLLYAGLLVRLAITVLRRKGVQRWRE